MQPIEKTLCGKQYFSDDLLIKAKKSHPIPNTSRYIVECSTDVRPPAYLRGTDVYNLSSIAEPDCKDRMLPFHSLTEEAWPRMEELGLDESQMKALQLALTKELAIIQGPPGTGKTLKSQMTSFICAQTCKMCFVYLLGLDLPLKQ